MRDIVAFAPSGEGYKTCHSVAPGAPPDDFLHWLVFCCSTRRTPCLRVVWSLQRLVSGVVSVLPPQVGKELSQPPHRARWGNYKLFCAPDKMFSVGVNGHEAAFYDLGQYFPERDEPETLAEMQALADQLRDTLDSLGMAEPKTLSSPVAIFKETVDQLDIPTVFDAPESLLDAHEIALRCTPREWVSNYQVGHFPALYGADISSAYPFHASQLLHLDDCVFRRSDSELDDRAYYGFLEGDFTVYPDHPLAWCSPFLADRGDGVLVNFAGTARGYSCTLDDVRTLYRHDLGEFRLRKGWFISPRNGARPRQPFRDFVGQLYSRRGESELASYLLKRVMNGVIGKLLESFRDRKGNITGYGDRYNPIYHAICTDRTRLQVFEALVRWGITREELAHVGVDGIKTTRDLKLPGTSVLGQWRQQPSASAFVLSPGAILTLERRFQGMDYADLLVECLAHPEKKIFGKTDLRRLFLNQTRVFPRLPRSGKELMDGCYLSGPSLL